GTAHIKVLDFGISKAPVALGEHKVTQESAVMGSPAYMAPEQLRNASEVTPKADIWSLGVILYELVSGTEPFVAESVPELFDAISESIAPKPGSTTSPSWAAPAFRAKRRGLWIGVGAAAVLGTIGVLAATGSFVGGGHARSGAADAGSAPIETAIAATAAAAA